MAESLFDVKFTVDNLIFENADTGFRVVRGKSVKIDRENDRDVVSYVFTGTFPQINRGDRLSVKCSWVYTKRGYQLNVVYCKREITRNKRSIKSFLVKHVKGIGPTMADKLIEKYGLDTIKVLVERPEEISKLKGIGNKRAESIKLEIQRYTALNELTDYFFKNGFANFDYIAKIYNKYLENSLQMVMDNPYSILPALPLEAFPSVDTFALSNGYAENNRVRLGKVIMYYLGMRKENGDAYVYKIDLFKDMYYFMVSQNLSVNGITGKDIDSAIEELEKTKQIGIETEENSERIYIYAYLKKENEVVSMLSGFNTTKHSYSNDVYERFFTEYEKETGISCSGEQKEAVRLATSKGFFVLTGLAGAGKTSTLKAILSFIKKNDKKAKVTLCSPTGRAAKRMTEVTGIQAYTIHRLLHLPLSDDLYSHVDEVDSDYLIVDEVSMVNLPVFHALLSASYKSKPTIILVGDKNQLPPVGVGFPFKDILDAGIYPSITLTKLFRQAATSQINQNANNILKGKITELNCELAKQDFFVFEEENAERAVELTLKTYKSLIENGGESADDIVILSPMKKTPLGAINLNRKIQSLINPKKAGMKSIISGDYELREGDKVMQLKNDYEKDVFNGDVGKIDRIDLDEKILEVVMDDVTVENGVVKNTKKKVTYKFSELDSLCLAYTMTVHKAQGSEFPCVIIPSSRLFVNTSKNLLYTAITRAKKRVVITGSKEAFIDGANNIQTVRRNSGLLEKILKQKEK